MTGRVPTFLCTWPATAVVAWIGVGGAERLLPVLREGIARFAGQSSLYLSAQHEALFLAASGAMAGTCVLAIARRMVTGSWPGFGLWLLGGTVLATLLFAVMWSFLAAAWPPTATMPVALILLGVAVWWLLGEVRHEE